MQLRLSGGHRRVCATLTDVCQNERVLRALLISTYDLGRQPFGLASPAAWLRREGIHVECADLARQRLDDEVITRADLIAFHLPMHTATRMAASVIRRVRTLNAGARIAAYGLYAPLNADWLRSLGVEDVIGGEFEADLTAVARRLSDTPATAQPASHERAGRTSELAKLTFVVPDRTGLLPLDRYATLHFPDGTGRVAGYTEASRGCRHLCRHCPIVPVYRGQFRVVQQDVVLADIDAQVAVGARHITFGDPDFFNGPTHARRIVEQLHQNHPSITYDVTIKVEHLLKHRDLLPVLRETGCLFVTSAVESVDDRVLAILEKGHTRADFEAAVLLCRESGLTLVPTFVPFHPWMSLDDYCDLLQAIVALDLIDHVAPIQLAIRLLLPAGSRLLELADVRQQAGEFDQTTLTHRWSHADRRVDDLQSEISALVGRRLTDQRRDLFAAIFALAHERTGRPVPSIAASPVQTVPRFDEPWYCCAEPNPEQLTLV
jgi:radical SAM superfamily enzyme YgiQ (UPF0313 family)